MPKDSRARRERMREANRRARAAESDEARHERLARNRARIAKKRAEETPEMRAARRANNAVRQRKVRAKETVEMRAARQAKDAVRHQEVRAKETPEMRAARHKKVRAGETLEVRMKRQPRDARLHQQVHRARLEQTLHDQRNLARYEDPDFFKGDLRGDYRQTMSTMSLFQYPNCSHCGAFVWEEDRKGFCCHSDVQLLLESNEEVPSKQQKRSPSLNQEDPPESRHIKEEWSPSLDQEDPPELPHIKEEWSPSLDQDNPPETPHIKEEGEELWISQEGEQLRGLEEADITKFTFTLVSVKSEEDDEEKPQSSQLHQRLTEQMETEIDGEDSGGPEPARTSDPDRVVHDL
ncbi:uncharacterized protein LOC119909658 [Micropterus salmoides]|uniref:uncharacterized protein LOC119909658 n=1 Tax=Micropterus salmoides TaxID=27706 RepID=UPI0018EC32A0|nr:uncharacterized protein LOC119909658 [Micropterus salmoides]